MKKNMQYESATALISWYDQNKRDLPWRMTIAPYPIWICEIMAQQTRINALLPYYTRFMAQFPDVYALANAPLDDVLKAWEGLGYYSRAHHLHKAAEIIVQEYDGILPADEKKMLSLPGIGAYTAAAILSISYNMPLPAVDGNVLRVFARLFNDSSDISLPQTRKDIAQKMLLLMPKLRPGAWNQAVMELGALVCLPKSPNCAECPIQAYCMAHTAGTQKLLPVKAPKKPQKIVEKAVFLLHGADNKIFMRKRSERLLHGLWEFYSLELLSDGNPFTAEAAVEQLFAKGILCKSVHFAGESSHTFTHIIWNMRWFYCEISQAEPPVGFVPVDMNDLPMLTIPSAFSYYKTISKP